jgi:hypothetical protein
MKEAYCDAVRLQFMGVSSHEDFIAANLRAHDLSYDVAVGEADYEAVLGRIILVLGLGSQALASIVVGLALSATLVLDLVPPIPELEQRTEEERNGSTYEKYASFFWSLDCTPQSQQLTLQTRIRSSLHRLHPTLRQAGSLTEGHHRRTPPSARPRCVPWKLWCMHGNFARSGECNDQGRLTKGILGDADSKCRCCRS